MSVEQSFGALCKGTHSCSGGMEGAKSLIDQGYEHRCFMCSEITFLSLMRSSIEQPHAIRIQVRVEHNLSECQVNTA